MWFAVAAAAVALVALSLVEIIKTKEPCTGCPDTPAAFCTLAAAPCSKVGLGKSKKVQKKIQQKIQKIGIFCKIFGVKILGSICLPLTLATTIVCCDAKGKAN